MTRFARTTSALALVLSLTAGPARSQNFTKITDPTNPIVTMAAGPPASFIGAAWVDADGDGDQDLFVVQRGLFRNDGGGTFARLADAVPSMGAATGNTWADADNDGDLDVYVTGGTPNGSSLYLNAGGNVFVKALGGDAADSLGNTAWAAAWGDVDRDGLVDLVLAAPFGFVGIDHPNRLFRNLGAGVLARVDTSEVAQGNGPYTVPSWSDFDFDGDLDLFIGAGPANGSIAPDYLYRNRAESAPWWLRRMTDAPLATDPHDGQLYNWIDFDNDGDLDVYLTNYGTPTGIPNDLYRNDGGAFVRLTGAQAGPIVTDAHSSLGSAWQDFDNDGDLDCYVANGGTNPGRFYRNNGNGTFTALSISGLTSNGPRWCAVAGDYDQDGDMDLYVTGTSAAHGLFQNTNANGFHWLAVRLTGTLSNRSAIGARVRVRAVIGGQPRWQLREVSAQNGFDGQSSLDAHFGLNTALVADSVKVEWPSGIVTVLTDVAADARIEVIEPGTTAVGASLITTSTAGGRARLEWALGNAGSRAFDVERREGLGDWLAAGVAAPDGLGRLVFEDAAVRPGARYGYRLAWTEDGIRRTGGEAWVEVPGADFGIDRITPNPARGGIALAFDLPDARAASVELIDVMGRRVDRVDVGALGAGRHTVRLGGHGLAVGLYLVRLTSGGRTATARAILVE